MNPFACVSIDMEIVHEELERLREENESLREENKNLRKDVQKNTDQIAFLVTKLGKIVERAKPNYHYNLT